MNSQIIPHFFPRAYFETAFSAAFLAWAHGEHAQNNSSILYAVFVFFGTWSVYNLLRVVSLFRRIQVEQNWRNVPDLLFVPLHIIIATIAGLTAFVLLFFQDFEFNGILFIGVLFFITLSYRFRWFNVQGNKLALSDLSYLKSFLVAGIWTLMCSIIPFNLQNENWLMFLSFFIYFFGLTIPFDIRDMNKDAPSRRTIPQVFGVSKAKFLSLIFVLTAHVLLTYQMQCSIVMFSISALIHTFLIAQSGSKTNQERLYRWLDAAPILLGMGMAL